MAGELHVLSSRPAEQRAIGEALDHLEQYIETVDRGTAVDPRYAKTAMYEAMLYMLASPFANEHMRVLRRRHGVLEPRGPKMLYLIGPSSNGRQPS